MRVCPLLASIIALLPFVVMSTTPSLRALQGGDGDDDDDMLELQLHAYNAPPGALDAIVSDAAKYMQFLLDMEPEYSGLEPGDAVVPDDRRALAKTATMKSTSSSNGPEGSSGDEAAETTRRIRGASSIFDNSERKLLTSCPTYCAKSSSASCKQLGCAYCGTRCRRRRRTRQEGQERELKAFGGKDAAKIAAKINARLLKACGTDPDCVIYVKIVRLSTQDGVEVEEPVV